MTKISKEELLALAHLSRLRIHEDEIEPLTNQIQNVLSYAQRVIQIASDIGISSNKNINVFEADTVNCIDDTALLAQAPDREGDFFVVPKILDIIEQI